MLHLSSLFQESANPSEVAILLVIGRIRRGVRSDPLAVPLAAAVQRGVPTWHPTIPRLTKNSPSPSRKKHRYGHLSSTFRLIKPSNKFLITQQPRTRLLLSCIRVTTRQSRNRSFLHRRFFSYVHTLVTTLHFNSLAYKWASEKKILLQLFDSFKSYITYIGWQKVSSRSFVCFKQIISQQVDIIWH